MNRSPMPWINNLKVAGQWELPMTGVLLGLEGSVASKLLPKRLLEEARVEVRARSDHFVAGDERAGPGD